MSEMYTGTKRFDREQLVFMVDVILTAAIDRIECVLPQDTSKEELARWKGHQDNFASWRNACLETAGHGLAVLWAQTAGDDIGDGLGTGDALQASGLEKLVDRLIRHRTVNWKGFKPGDKTQPDARKLAESFVGHFFAEYLVGPPMRSRAVCKGKD